MADLISIIIPIRNRPDLFRVCLDSLFKYTSEPFELIIVQDGEDEEVAKIIKDYKTKAVIYHKDPQGYVKAINAGFKEISSDTKYVMFLNADTCCVPGWLTEMLKCFKLDEKVGLVGPVFPAWGGIQNIECNPEYGDYTFVDEIIGVCMLFSRDVINDLMKNVEVHKVIGGGILDERYDIGGGDDNDIALRVKLCGYKTVVARKAFIYHYISASYREIFNHDASYSKKYAATQLTRFRQKFKKELGDKSRIFIAIPNNGWIHAELATVLIHWTHDPSISIRLFMPIGLSPLDNARNTCVKEFLEDYYDYILFIDNDIVPPLKALRELLKADKDIIAPLCFTWKRDDNNQGFPMPVAHRYAKNGEYEPYIGKGIEETDIVTGGMFLSKREVLEKMDRPFAFTYHANGTVIYSEDFYFAQKAQKLGYKLYTHYDLLCKHFRNIDIKEINTLMVQYGKCNTS